MFSHLKPVNIPPVFFWGVGQLKSSDKLQCIIYIRGLSGKALEILGVVSGIQSSSPRANPAWKTASIKYSISMASLRAGLETT